jgi:hypothetical protein
MPGCDQPVLARGWCNKHYLRWYRKGDPATEPNVLSGPAHYKWKPDSDLTYARVHQRIRRSLGQASQFQCWNDCGRQAQHWAYDHGDPDELIGKEGPYSVAADYYMALCVPCHSRMDRAWLDTTA